MLLSHRRPAEISRAGLFFAGLLYGHLLTIFSPYLTQLISIFSLTISLITVSSSSHSPYPVTMYPPRNCHFSSPVFTPTVWGCIGLIMLIMGPILWILHRSTPYYEYVASLFPLSKMLLKVPRHVLKARSLQHRLLFLHLLWKSDAAGINNSAGCRQRVTLTILYTSWPCVQHPDHTRIWTNVYNPDHMSIT